MPAPAQRQWHVVRVAARLLNVDETTVYDWIDSEKINWRRVDEAIEVQTFYDPKRTPPREPLPPNRKYPRA